MLYYNYRTGATNTVGHLLTSFERCGIAATNGDPVTERVALMSALEERDDVKSFVGQNSRVLDEKFLTAGHAWAKGENKHIDNVSDMGEEFKRLKISWVHFISPTTEAKNSDGTKQDGVFVNTFVTEEQYHGMKQDIAAQDMNTGKRKLSPSQRLYWDMPKGEFAKLKKGMSKAKAKTAQTARTSGMQAVGSRMGDYVKLGRAQEKRKGKTGDVRPLKDRLEEKVSTAIGSINTNNKLDAEKRHSLPNQVKIVDHLNSLAALLK